jgi:glycine/D-amino acid oxidase-like deaminating enzyme
MAKKSAAVQAKVAVIGGGIKGLCSAWELARPGAAPK